MFVAHVWIQSVISVSLYSSVSAKDEIDKGRGGGKDPKKLGDAWAQITTYLKLGHDKDFHKCEIRLDKPSHRSLDGTAKQHVRAWMRQEGSGPVPRTSQMANMRKVILLFEK